MLSLERREHNTFGRRINGLGFRRSFAHYALAHRYALINIARFPTYNGIGNLDDSALPRNETMTFNNIGIPVMQRPRCVLDTEAVKIGRRKRLQHPSLDNHITFCRAVRF
jgi:hypothetical protein